jgi:exonuclease III
MTSSNEKVFIIEVRWPYSVASVDASGFSSVFVGNSGWEVDEFEKLDESNALKFTLKNKDMGCKSPPLPTEFKAQDKTFHLQRGSRDSAIYQCHASLASLLGQMKIIAEPLSSTAVTPMATRQSTKPKTTEIQIITWNVMKGGVLEKEADKILALFEQQDIVLIQEVSSDSGRENLEAIVKKSKCLFLHFSELSGKCPDHKRREYHAIVTNTAKGWTAGPKSHTLHHDIHDDKQVFDYAPFTIELFNPLLLPKKDDSLFVTSVHFPPATRATDRDTQLKQFGPSYIQYLASIKKSMMGYHIVAGDFNTFPEMLTHHGFCSLSSEKLTTSSGHKSYDHFMTSKSVKEDFHVGVIDAIRTEINIEFKNTDHAPLQLRLVRELK